MKKTISSTLIIFIIIAMLPITALASDGLMTVQEYIIHIQKFTDEEIDRILDPTQYATLDEFIAGTKELTDAISLIGVNYWSNAADHEAASAANSELTTRAIERYRTAEVIVKAREHAIAQLFYLDTASSWAHDAILRSGYNMPLRLNGIIDRELDYKDPITRLEFLSMMMSWLESEVGSTYNLGSIIFDNHQAMHIFYAIVNTTCLLGVYDGYSSSDERFSMNSVEGTEITIGACDGSWLCTNTDHVDSWLVRQIRIAWYLGLSDGKNLYATLTREQAATMIMRAMRLAEAINNGFTYNHDEPGQISSILTSVENIPDAGFADQDNISSWARDGVNFAKANNIMQGSGNRFNPRGTFTVEEAVVTLSRVEV